eukprot:1147858-Pelagomonas_calceolata.AAC.9
MELLNRLNGHVFQDHFKCIALAHWCFAFPFARGKPLTRLRTFPAKVNLDEERKCLRFTA